MSRDFPLPEPIGEHKRFAWGPVVAIHRIGRLAIVEHHPQIYEKHCGTGDYDHTNTIFHLYVDSEDSCLSLHTLEQAVVFGLGHQQHGANDRAAEFACKLLDL